MPGAGNHTLTRLAASTVDGDRADARAAETHARAIGSRVAAGLPPAGGPPGAGAGSAGTPTTSGPGLVAGLGTGRPLAPPLLSAMEAAFGRDFGAVRVHTDGPADRAARGLHARAFTTGDDVAFRAGAFHPESASGRELIAHELAHVAQQRDARRASVQRAPDGSDPGAEILDALGASLAGGLATSPSTETTEFLLIDANALWLDFESGGPQTRAAAGAGLMAIYRELRAREQSAARAPDGALLTANLAGDATPWTPDRPHAVTDIPTFSPPHVAALLEWNAGAQPAAAAAPAPPPFHGAVTGGTSAESLAPQIDERRGYFRALALAQAQPQTLGERAAWSTAGGTEIKGALATLGGVSVVSLSQLAADRLNDVKAERPDLAGANVVPPTVGGSVLDATGTIWYVANRLYTVDRTGHINDADFAFGLQGISAELMPTGPAPAVYFFTRVAVQYQHEGSKPGLPPTSVNVLFRVDTAPTVSGGDLFPSSTLYGLIPLLERGDAVLEAGGGIGIVISPTVATRQTMSDFDPNKVFAAVLGAVDHLPWALTKVLLGYKENPGSAVATVAMGLATEGLLKLVPELAPPLMMYQALEIVAWAGNVANIAAYALTDDEVDLASQAIAEKISEWAVAEAMTRGVKAAGGAAVRASGFGGGAPEGGVGTRGGGGEKTGSSPGGGGEQTTGSGGRGEQTAGSGGAGEKVGTQSGRAAPDVASPPVSGAGPAAAAPAAAGGHAPAAPGGVHEGPVPASSGVGSEGPVQAQSPSTAGHQTETAPSGGTSTDTVPGARAGDAAAGTPTPAASPALAPARSAEAVGPQGPSSAEAGVPAPAGADVGVAPRAAASGDAVAPQAVAGGDRAAVPARAGGAAEAAQPTVEAPQTAAPMREPTLSELRRMAKTDRAAFEQLVERYDQFSPDELLRRASAGDPLAQYVLDNPRPQMSKTAFASLVAEIWERRRAAVESAGAAGGSASSKAATAAATKGTMGALETDIPGVDDVIVRGSPEAPTEITENTPESRTYRPASTHGKAQFHAEEQLLNALNARIKGLPASELAGRTVRIVVDQAVCQTCKSGVGHGEHGVLLKFSADHPQLRIEVTDMATGEFQVFEGGTRTRYDRAPSATDTLTPSP